MVVLTSDAHSSGSVGSGTAPNPPSVRTLIQPLPVSRRLLSWTRTGLPTASSPDRSR